MYIHIQSFTDQRTDIWVGRFTDSEDRNVAVNLCSVPLSYTLCNPDDVSVFLFLQFHIRIENTKVELLHKSILHQFDLKKRRQK